MNAGVIVVALASLISTICTAVMLLVTAIVGHRACRAAMVTVGITRGFGAASASLLLIGLWQRGAVLDACLAMILVGCTAAVIWWRHQADVRLAIADDDFLLWERELADPRSDREAKELED